MTPQKKDASSWGKNWIQHSGAAIAVSSVGCTFSIPKLEPRTTGRKTYIEEDGNRIQIVLQANEAAAFKIHK